MNANVDSGQSASTSPGSAPIKRFVLIAAGFTISAAALWWVLHGVDFSRLLASAGRISVPWTLAAIAVYWGALVSVRSILIRRLLRPVGTVRLVKAYRYICVGFLANTVLPLKMGEVARSAGIARSSKIRFSSVVGSLAVERLLDMVMLGLIGVAAIQFAHLFVSIPGEIEPARIRTPALVAGAVFFAAFIALIVVARTGWSRAEQTTDEGSRAFVRNILLRFLAGLRAIGTTRGVIAAVVLAAVIWSLGLLSLMLRLVAFDLPPSIPMVLLVMTSVGLSVTVPSTPGYLGVYHAAVVFALRLLGVDELTAVGFAFFSHLVDTVPAVVLGAACLTLEGLSWSDLRRTGDNLPEAPTSE